MGVRGLCNGLGPAAFGLMWHLFGIDIINDGTDDSKFTSNSTSDVYLGRNLTMKSLERNYFIGQEKVIKITEENALEEVISQMPGLPFLIISFCVLLALICSAFLKDIHIDYNDNQQGPKKDDLENSQNSNSDVPLAKEESGKVGETL